MFIDMANAQSAVKMVARHTSALLCSIVVLVGIAASEELHPGIVGDPDAKTNGPPWTAIGHVNVAGYRTTLRCSGVLVKPNLVLTAAHCLIDPWKKTAFSLDRIHFLQYVDGARWIGQSRAKCLHFLPGQQ